MRIIAGLAKGMPLRVPRGTDVRPTSDRVREAIFSSLGEHVVDATVLDLYAGTGALGLEAASRGAMNVTFVEKAHEAVRCLQENIETFKQNRDVVCELNVRHADASAQLRKFSAESQTFSLVFADPPYGEIAQQLLSDPNLLHVLAADGLFVLESAKRDQLAGGASWIQTREAIYGDTRVSFLKPV